MKRGFDALIVPMVFACGTLFFLCTAVAVDRERGVRPFVKSFLHRDKALDDRSETRRAAHLNWFRHQETEVEPPDSGIVKVSDAALATEKEPAPEVRPASTFAETGGPAVQPAISRSNSATTTKMRVVTNEVPVESPSLNSRYERMKLALPDEEPEVLTLDNSTTDDSALDRRSETPLSTTAQGVNLTNPTPSKMPTETGEETPFEPRPTRVANKPAASSAAPKSVDQPDAINVTNANDATTQQIFDVAPHDVESERPTPAEAATPEPEANNVTPPAPAMQPATNVARANNCDDGVQLVWNVPEQVSTDVEADCQLMVQNPSDSPAYRVTVYVELPEDVKLGNATENYQIDGPQVIWEFDQIEAGGERTLRVGIIPQSSGSLAPRAAVTFTRIATASFSVLEPRIQVTIEGPENLVAGQIVNYSLLISNLGTGAATDVSMQVQLDEKLRHSEGTDLHYFLGTIPASEMRRVQVPLLAGTQGECPITASAISHGQVRSEVEQVVHIVEPKLELAVHGPKMRYVNRKADYAITVRNPGPAVVNNVQVFDDVPAGFRFASATSGGTYDRTTNQVAWFVGRLEPEQTAELGVEFVATDIGSQPMTTVVKADSGVREEAATMTIVEGVASVALELVDEDDPIEVEGETTYQVRVTNQGSKPAEGVQVAVALPKEMELVNTDGPTDATLGTQRVVFEPIASLEPEATMVYRVRVRCLEAGNVAFRAFYRTSESPQAVGQEELTRIYAD